MLYVALAFVVYICTGLIVTRNSWGLWCFNKGMMSGIKMILLTATLWVPGLLLRYYLGWNPNRK